MGSNSDKINTEQKFQFFRKIDKNLNWNYDDI